MEAKSILLGALDVIVPGLGFLGEIVELITTEDEPNYLSPIISLSSSVIFPTIPQTSLLNPKDILSGLALSYASSYFSNPVEIVSKGSIRTSISNVYDDIIERQREKRICDSCNKERYRYVKSDFGYLCNYCAVEQAQLQVEDFERLVIFKYGVKEIKKKCQDVLKRAIIPCLICQGINYQDRTKAGKCNLCKGSGLLVMTNKELLDYERKHGAENAERIYEKCKCHQCKGDGKCICCDGRGWLVSKSVLNEIGLSDFDFPNLKLI
jgi:hypothetical protein